jgi:20S proteasome subunit beta 4
MDSLIALRGKDWVLMAADCSDFYSLFRLKNHADKVRELSPSHLISYCGERSDILQFHDYVARNVAFYHFKNGYRLQIDETAQYVRSTLAEALRKGPYNANALLGGVDGGAARLFWIDYLGTLVEVEHSAQGNCSHIVNSIMDVAYRKEMTLEEGIEVIQRCIREITHRMILNNSAFVIKAVTPEGVRVIVPAKCPIPDPS